MFKFLKEKIKEAVSRISKKVEEESPDELVEQAVEKPKKEAPKEEREIVFEAKKPTASEIISEVKTEEIKETEDLLKEPEKKEKIGFFKRLFGKKEEKTEELPKLPELPKTEEEKKEEIVKEEPKKEIKKEIILEAPKPSKEKIRVETEKIKKIKEEIAEIKPEQKPEIKKEEIKKIIEEVKEVKEELKEIVEEKKEEEKEEKKKGFFGFLKEKITTKKISEEQFEELFWDLEVTLMENNVAVEVIQKIKDDLKSSIVDIPIPRTKVSETITDSLKTSIKSLFEVPSIDIIKAAKLKKPYIICFVGINASGKTTTIAKFAKYCIDNGLNPVMAAADTFRAAAIEQLQMHADALGVKLIKHDYGADAAAVAFDAIKYAEAKGKDVVLIDTAGRMHTNTNLTDEMKKIIRVAKPDLKVFVGESITGNDCVEQAKNFNEAINVDGIILAKADIDEKGGAAISVSYVTKKPILFLGTGQKYEDIKPFDKEFLIESLGL